MEARSQAAPFDPVAAYRSLYDEMGAAGGPLNRQLYAELKAWLPDTLFAKTDKPTMARGIEARMPLFDHRLVELAFAIPAGRRSAARRPSGPAPRG